MDFELLFSAFWKLTLILHIWNVVSDRELYIPPEIFSSRVFYAFRRFAFEIEAPDSRRLKFFKEKLWNGLWCRCC
jgi:hypothetical protein